MPVSTTKHQDDISVYRIRPRFRLELPGSIEDVQARIQAGLSRPDAPCQGIMRTGYAALALPKADQHYWSPRLTLSLEPSEAGCEVSGLYGPRPEVWTMFMFLYGLMAFGVIMVGLVGLSYATLGKNTDILWLLPIFLLAWGGLYLVSYSGQKLGEKQMHVLHGFLEDCTGVSF